MGTHAIIVVHGIGEQTDGETIDQVVGAAAAAYDAPVTVASNVIQLEERVDTEDKYDLFPAHTRRVKPANVANKEAIFTEVFWADISPAPVGPFWTMFDLLRVVLGLG